MSDSLANSQAGQVSPRQVSSSYFKETYAARPYISIDLTITHHTQDVLSFLSHTHVVTTWKIFVTSWKNRQRRKKFEGLNCSVPERVLNILAPLYINHRFALQSKSLPLPHALSLSLLQGALLHHHRGVTFELHQNN